MDGPESYRSSRNLSPLRRKSRRETQVSSGLSLGALIAMAMINRWVATDTQPVVYAAFMCILGAISWRWASSPEHRDRYAWMRGRDGRLLPASYAAFVLALAAIMWGFLTWFNTFN